MSDISNMVVNTQSTLSELAKDVWGFSAVSVVASYGEKAGDSVYFSTKIDVGDDDLIQVGYNHVILDIVRELLLSVKAEKPIEADVLKAMVAWHNGTHPHDNKELRFNEATHELIWVLRE